MNTGKHDAASSETMQWVQRLLDSAGRERRHAATELSRLGIAMRGSVRTRGSILRAAADRLPDRERLQDLTNCLQDTDKDVRCRIALALGEWGGPIAAEALRKLLESDADKEVQLYCITGLRTIGGPTATDALRQAVAGGDETVRASAIAALEELATGGRSDDTEPSATTSSPIQSGGSPHASATVRTRGSLRQGSEDILDRVAETLQRISADDTASEYLRMRAQEVLDHLQAG